MAKLKLVQPTKAHTTAAELYEAIDHRLAAGTMPPCPVEFTSAVVGLCSSQSCGKCAPCRIGLPQLQQLIEQVLDAQADEATLALIEKTARNIYLSGNDPDRTRTDDLRRDRAAL